LAEVPGRVAVDAEELPAVVEYGRADAGADHDRDKPAGEVSTHVNVVRGSVGVARDDGGAHRADRARQLSERRADQAGHVHGIDDCRSRFIKYARDAESDGIGRLVELRRCLGDRASNICTCRAGVAGAFTGPQHRSVADGRGFDGRAADVDPELQQSMPPAYPINARRGRRKLERPRVVNMCNIWCVTASLAVTKGSTRHGR
jgi:hypothetical protein